MPGDPLHDEHHRDDAVEPRLSRTAERRERKEREAVLARLAEELCALPSRRLRLMELPETLLSAVAEARRITSDAARNRAIRRIRQELRALGDSELAQNLRAGVLPPPRAQVGAPTPVVSWRTRLLAEGEQGIDAFLENHSEANRRELRVLLRHVSRAAETAKPRALSTLDRYLARAIAATPPVPAEDSPGEA